MDFDNKLKFGTGIYTSKEISKILKIPTYKVNRWMRDYWDGKLGRQFKNTYSWKVDNSRAIGFHALVELYILNLFIDTGVNTKEVLKAHIELTNIFDTPFPFARKDIIENIKTDGKKIYIELPKGGIISLDGKKQFQLEIIQLFFKTLVFDENQLASKLYPLGKEKDIVVDPKRQFGQPVIGDSNILPEVVYNMYKAGEPKKFIAFTYQLTEKQVQSAIEYCRKAA